MLPTLNAPTFETKLISLDMPVRYRPFTVKEEKILLIAEEGKEEKEVLFAIRQILQNCLVTQIDVNRLPLFDLEYLFLQIRSKSVTNVSTVKYRDLEDEEVREFEINFDKITPQLDPNHTTEIKLQNDFIVTFKYPTIEMMSKIDISKLDEVETSLEMVAECLDKIIQGEDAYLAENYTQEERMNFLESLSVPQFEKILDELVTSMPKMVYKIDYTNNLGNEREIVLEGFMSFLP